MKTKNVCVYDRFDKQKTYFLSILRQISSYTFAYNARNFLAKISSPTKKTEKNDFF